MTTGKPIIFSTAMVQAILDGRKTQTRRVVKPQPVSDDGKWVNWGYSIGASKKTAPRNCVWHGETWQTEQNTAPIDKYCPYGQPGGILWVKETWQECAECGRVNWHAGANDHGHACQHCDEQLGKWRPSIFMPRWASRLTLQITGVRVERVQDISEADAKAEGVELDVIDTGLDYEPSYRGPFAELWDAINTKRGYSWDSNPWVWVIEFEVRK